MCQSQALLDWISKAFLILMAHSHHLVSWSSLLQQGGVRPSQKRLEEIPFLLICFTTNTALFPSTAPELSAEEEGLLQCQQPQSCGDGQAGSLGWMFSFSFISLVGHEMFEGPALRSSNN